MPNTIEHTAARDLADRIDNGSVTIVHVSPRVADCDKGRALVVKALRAYKKPRAAPEGMRDQDRLDWMQERIVDTIYFDDGKIIDVAGNSVRDAIDVAMQEAATAPEPAITTEQLDKAQFGRVLHARPEPTDTPDEGPDPLGYAKGER